MVKRKPLKKSKKDKGILKKLSIPKSKKKAIAKGKLEPAEFIEAIEIPREEQFKYTFNKKKRVLEDRYEFDLRSPISGKKNWFTYRDHYSGRFVKKSDIVNSVGGVRMELWRYSRNAEFRLKLLWREKKYTKLQKPRSLDRERSILRRFYKRNKSRFVWDKDLQSWIAFTRSP